MTRTDDLEAALATAQSRIERLEAALRKARIHIDGVGSETDWTGAIVAIQEVIDAALKDDPA